MKFLFPTNIPILCIYSECSVSAIDWSDWCVLLIFFSFFLFSVAVLQKNSTHDQQLWFKAQALVAQPWLSCFRHPKETITVWHVVSFIFRSSSGSSFPMPLMLWIRSACCLWPMTMHWQPTKSWPSKLRSALLSEWDILVARFIPHW